MAGHMGHADEPAPRQEAHREAPQPEAPRRAAPRRAATRRAVPWLFAALTLLGQIAWVLVQDPWRDRLTLLTVVTFFLASASHAMIHRGFSWAAGYLAVSLGIGFGVELLGTATGLPFGDYAYNGTLGPQLGGVPLLIPLAWAMMSYPCLLAARRLSSSALVVPLFAAWTLAAWDLFLDPQMVGEGHWTFADPVPALPGSPGIPLSNYAGWLVTGIVLFLLLDRLPRRGSPRDGALPEDSAPAALLAWTYLSNVMAAAVFWGRPAVAAWGAALMGLTMIPWLRSIWPDARKLLRAGDPT